MEAQEHAKADDTSSMNSDAQKGGPTLSDSNSPTQSKNNASNAPVTQENLDPTDDEVASMTTPSLSSMNPSSSSCGGACCSPFFAMLPLQKRIVLLTGCYITFFAGAVFGWGPMQLMLEADGAFSYKCTPEEVAAGVICQQQTISLLRVPLIAGLCSILSPMLGHVADEYGSHVLVQVMSLFGVVGISLIMTASGTGVDWILFVAFSFLYLMLMSGSIMITKTGLLFDNGDSRRRVISVLNALLDAGSMTYLILLKILHGIEGATFLGVMGGYLGFAALCFGLTCHQWIRMGRQLEKEGDAAIAATKKSADDKRKPAKISTVVTSTRIVLTRLFSSAGTDTNSISEKQEAKCNPDADISEMKGTALKEECNHAAREEEDDDKFFDEPALGEEDGSEGPSVRRTSVLKEKNTREAEDDDELYIEARFGGDDVHDKARSSVRRFSLLSQESEELLLNEKECFCQIDPNSKHKLIRSRSAKEQLRSELYLLTLGYYIFHGLRNIFTLTTARDFLGYLGDDYYNNRYLSIFTFLNAASILGQPGIDWVLKKHGYGAGLQAVNVLGLAHGIILVASTNLNVQVFGFVIFSFYRGFLFSVVFSFLATYLGANVIGKGAGIMSATSAVLKFINLPLANWAVTKLDGNFFWPNFIYMIGMLPCLAMAWRVGRIVRQENAAEKYVCLNCRVKQDTVELKINRRVSLSRRPSVMSIAASLEPSDRRLSHLSTQQRNSITEFTRRASGINDSPRSLLGRRQSSTALLQNVSRRDLLDRRRSSILSLTIEGLDLLEGDE